MITDRLKFPDPPIPVFFGQEKARTPKKARISLPAEPLKILGKESKNAQKSKENRKMKRARKTKKTENWKVRVISELIRQSRNSRNSVEPKVRLQGYGYSLFCSHSSRCLKVLVWQYFEEAFRAPKARLNWYGFKGVSSHSSHCFGDLFPQYSGGSPEIVSHNGNTVTDFNLFRN